MTRKQLERFVATRNKSGFASNLQFQIDASEAGFEVSDLGDVLKVEDGYIWHTKHGRLIERHGVLTLEPMARPVSNKIKRRVLTALNG